MMQVSRVARRASAAAVLALLLVVAQQASGQDRPPPREHTVIQSDGELNLEPATLEPPGQSSVSITVEGDDRVIRANGLPDHLVGQFPNRGNPHSIRMQRYSFDLPAEPRLAERTTPLGLFNFGMAIDGVPFDPGAAEWYKGDPQSGWRYAALSGAVPLGLDENYAHVQPSGAYHYHGLPTLLLRRFGLNDSRHSPLVGWAADGFPIYAIYGYVDPEDPAAGVAALRSSYRVKPGERPSGGNNPGGTYDGTFIADFEYVANAGELDACNGRQTVTPDFPAGTYAYFLSPNWPVIPRCFKGTPSKAFTEQRGGP